MNKSNNKPTETETPINRSKSIVIPKEDIDNLDKYNKERATKCSVKVNIQEPAPESFMEKQAKASKLILLDPNEI